MSSHQDSSIDVAQIQFSFDSNLDLSKSDIDQISLIEGTDRTSQTFSQIQDFDPSLFSELSNTPNEGKKDSLINNLEKEIQEQKTSNSKFISKIANAIDKMEDLFNIQNDGSMDLYERLMSITSVEYKMQESIRMQLSDILNQDLRQKKRHRTMKPLCWQK